MSGYSIWVLEYATSPKHPVSGVLYGRHNQGTMNLPFAYVLIKGRDTVAIVDVGYNATDFGGEIARSIGVQNWVEPRDVLSECDVSPDDIQHAFITHAHFDHMGGLDFFPNATFYIQEKELASWVWAMSKGRQFRFLMGGINPADILRLVDLGVQGRLVSIDGYRQNIIPGIDLVPAFDTHTAGSQYVVVRSGDGSEEVWVLSGDVVYTYANLQGEDPSDPCFVPPGLATGSQTNLILAAADMMERAGGELRRVVPVHEERLKENFPSRVSDRGLRITEIALAKGETSRVA
jgi:glyoxylase-like metal-dependent hydrolase (beta-lactamase superfamily II)